MQELLYKLDTMAKRMGPRKTEGLTHQEILNFLPEHPALAKAIQEGFEASEKLLAEFPFLAQIPEEKLLDNLQEGLLNFYPMDQRNPYVPAAARGPWIVTLFGAVLHDSGGYGMLGFGHNPEPILKSLQTPLVMANVMTASVSHYRLIQSLRAEIGHRREHGCPYSKFICINSGSEAMTVAMRIADAHTRWLFDRDAAQGRPRRRTMLLSIQGSFHGRTERPAMISHSSYKSYATHLESFRDLHVNYTIPPNDEEALLKAFQWAKEHNVFFEVLALEPVMGEGNPGLAVKPSYYALARRLTRENETLLLMDSIQAGLRAHGSLSVVDYPGFTDLDAPDLETYSKALNGGQFPLSILAINKNTEEFYRRGIYGNTKTTNPRACEVAVATLSMVTEPLRANIVARGQELLQGFMELGREYPEIVLRCQGQGLLCAIEINPDAFRVVGHGQLGEYLRCRGIGVIHGGKNALRFTPHFAITSKEVQLILRHLKEAFEHGPKVPAENRAQQQPEPESHR